MSAQYLETYPKLPLYGEAAQLLMKDTKTIRQLLVAGSAFHQIHRNNWDLIRAKAELTVPINRNSKSTRLRISKISTPYLYKILADKNEKGLVLILLHIGVMSHLKGDEWLNTLLHLDAPLSPQPKQETILAEEPKNDDSNKNATKLISVPSPGFFEQLEQSGMI